MRALARAGVAGAHARYTEHDLRRHIRAVADGDRGALLGLEPFLGVTSDEVAAAARATWGWGEGEITASIDPGVTLDRFRDLVHRLDEEAAAGGAVAFATGRPASLLPLYTALERRAEVAGAAIAAGDTDTAGFLCDGRADRRLRWIDRVAVVTDGAALLPTLGVEAGDELLFHVGRPTLVVADHGFATAAVRRGIEIAAFVDFDAVVLALVARQLPERAMTLVPLDDQRMPQDYDVLTALVSDIRKH